MLGRERSLSANGENDRFAVSALPPIDRIAALRQLSD